MMEFSRREFLGSVLAGSALLATPGCMTRCCEPRRLGRPALQLYSLNRWIPALNKDGKKALAKALARIRSIGYEGVEFAGYYGADSGELKRMLDDNGLFVCGTHVGADRLGMDTKQWTYDPDVLARTAEFNRAYGNDLVINPGEGNFPPGCTWTTGYKDAPVTPSKAIDEFTKKLVDFYNRAAADARRYGIRIGIHNHVWEHAVFMTDGTSFWDYFLTNTDPSVCMEQDVGWSTCAGIDPKAQYRRYPHRSPTLHAKENGMGKDVKDFEGILGHPGRPGATPVDWDGLFPVTDADGVGWYVVECERHFDDPEGAVIPSFEFLKRKGRV